MQRFKAGDIVWVAANQVGPLGGPTSYEECKVLSYNERNNEYEIIVPNNGVYCLASRYLFLKAELPVHKTPHVHIYNGDDFSEFGLVKGMYFYALNGFLQNDQLGLYIELEYYKKHLTHLFNVVPRASLQNKIV